MLFFIKNRKIVLDCFTSDSSAFEYAKPKEAVHFIPDWWKRIPKPNQSYFFPQPNMKHCWGFVEYFRTGFALPLWAALDVRVGPIGTTDYEWQFSNRTSEAGSHGFEQTGNFLKETEHVHLKLKNPWLFFCKEDVRFAWEPFGWRNFGVLNYHVLPGVITYKYQHIANINILFARTQSEQIIRFAHGSPIVHMAPISERKVVLKHHLVSEEEHRRLNNYNKPLSFVNAFKTIKNLQQKWRHE